MVYTTQYASPLGAITLACDDTAIIGLWFDGQKYFGNILPEQVELRSILCLRRRGAGWISISPGVRRISCRRSGMILPRSGKLSARSC